MSRIGIVIVNYNSTEYLKSCLRSIQSESTGPLPEVIVVDNSSRDFQSRQIEGLYPDLRVITNDRNLGFAVGCNQGLRLLSAKYYLLLNPDCEIQDHAIDRTLDFIDSNPKAGIVGCRVTNPDGTLQLACRRRIPHPSIAFFRLTGLDRIFPASRRFDSYNMSDLLEDHSHEVEAVSGSFLMMRDQVYRETGGLDERFFLYGEDLDLCLRTAKEGWKLFYFSNARVIHHKRRSSSTESRAAIFHFYNAMELFYRKHFCSKASLPERVAVISGIRILSMFKRVSQTIWRHHEVGSDS